MVEKIIRETEIPQSFRVVANVKKKKNIIETHKTESVYSGIRSYFNKCVHLKQFV